MLSDAERDQAKSLDHPSRQQAVRLLREMTRIFDRAVLPILSAERRKALRKQLLAGLLFDDYSQVRPIHDTLQGEVENYLKSTLSQLVSDSTLQQLRGRANVAAGKGLHNLTYAERIRLAIEVVADGKVFGGSDRVHALMSTVGVRNAFAHTRYEDLSIEETVKALRVYLEFLVATSSAL
jgi:hypothetical protein